MKRLVHIAWIAALGMVGGLLLGSIPGARAEPGLAPLHLELDKSAPEADASLAESPSEITLWFTQAPRMEGTSIRLLPTGGEPLDLGDAVASEEDAKVVILTVPRPLADGSYTVSWRAMASDGHVVRGDFDFTVAAEG